MGAIRILTDTHHPRANPRAPPPIPWRPFLSAADRVMEDTDENTADDAVMQLSPAEKDTLTELEGR